MSLHDKFRNEEIQKVEELKLPTNPDREQVEVVMSSPYSSKNQKPMVKKVLGW